MPVVLKLFVIQERVFVFVFTGLRTVRTLGVSAISDSRGVAQNCTILPPKFRRP
jgi:hypothetical protein